MIRFACPSCKSVMEAREEYAGKKVPCSRCRKAVIVPARPVARPVALPVAVPVSPAPMATAVPVAPRMAALPVARGARGKIPMKLVLAGAAFGLFVVFVAVYAIVQNVIGGSGKEVAAKPKDPVVRPPDEDEPKQPPSTPVLRNMDELIAGLSHKSLDVRRQAAQELNKSTRIDKKAALPLATLLKEPGDGSGAIEVRKLAAKGLAKMGADAEPAIPQLTAALADPNKEVQLLALDALGKVGKPGLGAVTDALRMRDPQMQVKAATILGGYGRDASSAVATLLAIIAESNRDHRVRIAVPLVKIDPAQTELTKYLVDALGDSNDNTRRQAWVAIGIMGPHAKAAENELFDAYNNELNAEVKNLADEAYRKVTGQ